MSKRTEMFARIAATMPEDAEVQEWVAKELERANKSAAKTAERLDMAIEVLKRHVSEDEAVSAKEFAHARSCRVRSPRLRCTCGFNGFRFKFSSISPPISIS